MAVTTKLKWKKLTIQLRYMHQELDIVKNMADEAGKEFQQHYEDYCSKNNIDLNELNNKHNERIEKLYAQKREKLVAQEYSGSTDLILPKDNKNEIPNFDVPKELEFTNQEDKEMHDIFSKLFRKLATILHPDKLANSKYDEDRKEELKLMFTKAKTALEDRKYFILIDYAERLNIPTPKNYKQQIKWMKTEIDLVRSEIAAITRTYNYSFAEAETEEQKDNLIRKFMTQVFGFDPTNKN